MLSTRQLYRSNNQPAGYAALTQFAPEPFSQRLAHRGRNSERVMIDATHLKAHRTAASLLNKGLFPDVSGAPKAA
jgi:hypothetical protein